MNLDSGEGVVATCPKHGGVTCTTDEYLAAVMHHKKAVYFYARAPIARRSDEG